MVLVMKQSVLLLIFSLSFTLRAEESLDDWSVCTVEQLMGLSETALNTIQPPFIEIQSVRSFIFPVKAF